MSQAGKPLHTVSRHQFVDSPEWFGVAADEHFQVGLGWSGVRIPDLTNVHSDEDRITQDYPSLLMVSIS